MNCREVDGALIEAAELPSAAREHVKTCESCRKLLRTLHAPRGEETPSPDRLLQIARSLQQDLRPVRPLWATHYFLCAFGAIFVLIVAFAAYRTGPFAISVMTPIQAGAILSALAASAGLLAYSLVHQMVPGSRHRLNQEILAPWVIVTLLLIVAGLFQFEDERNFWRTGWACLKAGTSFALLATAPFLLLLRRGAILSPRITGATAGLLAGLVGMSVLELHCTDLNAAHLLTWHLGVAVLGAITGLAAAFAGEFASRYAGSFRHGNGT